MNLFFRELKANRKALIIWSICMVIGVLSGMSKYTTYSSGGAASAALMALPHTIRAVFGMGSFDVASMSGFYAFLFSYIELAVAVHAALLGSTIIAKEERDKTTEFLMVKPISRARVITAKLLAALVNLILLNLVTLLSSVFFVAAYNKGKDITGEIILFCVTLLVVQLVFLSLGALLAAVLRHSKASGAVATSVLFGAYIIAKVTDITTHLNVLNILSPFKYFDAADIVRGEGIGAWPVILSLALAGLFAAAAYYFYTKRDLSI
ncbi:ABC transporter permease subunit [Sporolactobacillus vineae]|uniref:ABC transporter permease subunit n=1 Tax=Sporolactobacillus vineae TaxID=444463 RepID=UPI00028884AA|nr:ABC transporter permease subunit [Sporolactobacillus vineae]